MAKVNLTPLLPNDAAAPVGLLAGWGRFPIVFAEKARNLNIPVVCVGVRDEASPELLPLVERFYWAGVARLGRIIRCFKKAGVRQIVMAGKIHKVRIFSPLGVWRLLPDWRTIRFWFRRRRQNNADDSLLLSMIDEFATEGMSFASALDFCPELLVKDGILTRRGLTSREEDDLVFGWSLAKEMGRLDIGQSVAVRDKAVLAVEAIEGTDQAIQRAGQLCRRGGFVVVKVAKPRQDMRFDVPTVGVGTIETMRRAGARVLAIEAGKTIVLDQEQTVSLANQYGISIVARAA
jgi:UDP-2,3-diacylglucosamine hydrolase